MLEGYLEEKGALYNRDSRFSCPRACRCPGCSGVLVVSASLLEIHAQAVAAGVKTGRLFTESYVIAPYYDGGLGRVRIRFLLRRPCPFFGGSRCGIYRLRPAACALFPEFLSVMDSGDEFIRGNDLDFCACVAEGYSLSPARRETLRKLWRLHQREIMATELYLFGKMGYTIDIREEAAARVSAGATIPKGAVEDAFNQVMERQGLGDHIFDRVACLNEPSCRAHYLSFMAVAEFLQQGLNDG